MEGGSIKDLAKYRFEKAVSNIKVAKTLYSSGDYSVALNRAYYSAFDAIRAINALDGFDSSKHSGVIAHFNQEYVKTGKFSPPPPQPLSAKHPCLGKNLIMKISTSRRNMKRQALSKRWKSF